MKTNTTYPTKHPHWIDEDSYSRPRKRRRGISFFAATAIVIAIHLGVVGGVYLYTSLPKLRKAVPTAAPEVEKKPGPKSDALARNEWPQPDAKPQAVATPPPKPAAIAKATPTATTKEVAKAPSPVPAKAEKKPEVLAQAARSDSEELKRKFLAATGKTNGVRDTLVRRAIPVESKAEEAVRVAEPPKSDPQLAQDARIPVRRAEAVASNPVPKPVAVARAVPSAGSSPTHYTLAPGDNLYMVSRKLGVSFDDLKRANGISDPRLLRVGQTLKVPTMASL
jgi:LysM repeat protein